MKNATRRIITRSTLAGVTLILLQGAGASLNAQETPNFYEDVQPILQNNCAVCHRPVGPSYGGMVAPMALITYEDVRPWAAVIAAVVKEGRMPPWFAATQHRGTFENERYLEEEEKEILSRWAEAGAPAGDPKDAVEWTLAEDEDQGEDEAGGLPWTIGEPDVVAVFREPFEVDDRIQDLVVNVPLKFEQEITEPLWIKASELHPGGSVVHHMCVFEIFGCVAPGWPPYEYPEGYAVLLAPNREMSFSMHYHKTPGPGTGAVDVSKGGAVLYEDGDVIQHVVQRTPLGTMDIFIPAGDPNYTVTHEKIFTEDTYIMSLTPHMHYRGKSAKYELVFPDGERELLLHVPKYDFNWQLTYRFREPPVAPTGSKIVFTATFDNSAGNPHNPDPTRDVPRGAPTTDEMANGWLDYAAVEPVNIIVGEPLPEELHRLLRFQPDPHEEGGLGDRL